MDQNASQTSPVVSQNPAVTFVNTAQPTTSPAQAQQQGESPVTPPAPQESTPSQPAEATPSLNTPQSSTPPPQSEPIQPINSTPAQDESNPFEAPAQSVNASGESTPVDPTAPVEPTAAPSQVSDTPTPPVDTQASTPAAIPTGDITDEYREKLYEKIAQAMLDGLETGEIEVEASEDSSVFIMDRLDVMQTIPEVLPFLEELSSKWPVYSKVLQEVQNELSEQKDQAKIADIQDQIQQMTH